MIYKKILQLVLTFMLLSSVVIAQKDKGEKKSKNAFQVKQHVMITMKDGSEIEGVIHSHISRNNYWVRQYHNGRQGKVKAKYLRPLSETEVANLTKKK